jgi:PBP1b-binding outer membrane lipoprotein LpoB
MKVLISIVFIALLATSCKVKPPQSSANTNPAVEAKQVNTEEVRSLSKSDASTITDNEVKRADAVEDKLLELKPAE